MDYSELIRATEEFRERSLKDRETYERSQARRKANFLEWARRDYEKEGIGRNQAEEIVTRMEPIWRDLGKFAGMSDSGEEL